MYRLECLALFKTMLGHLGRWILSYLRSTEMRFFTTAEVKPKVPSPSLDEQLLQSQENHTAASQKLAALKEKFELTKLDMSTPEYSYLRDLIQQQELILQATARVYETLEKELVEVRTARE